MKTGLSILLFCLIFFAFLQFGVLYVLSRVMHTHLTYRPRRDLINGKQIHICPHSGTYRKEPFTPTFTRKPYTRNPDLMLEKEEKLIEIEKKYPYYIY